MCQKFDAPGDFDWILLDVTAGLEPFQVKWIRFAVEKASETKTRADSMQVETALARRTEKWTRFSVPTDAPAREMERRMIPKSGIHFSVRCSRRRAAVKRARCPRRICSVARSGPCDHG